MAKGKRVKKWWMIVYVDANWLGPPESSSGMLSWDHEECHAAVWFSERKARKALRDELKVTGNPRKDYRIVPLAPNRTVMMRPTIGRRRKQ